MSVVIGVLLFLLSPFAMLAGFISVIYPLRFLHIYSRRMAFGVLAASLVMLVTGTEMVASGTHDRQQRQQVSAVQQPPTTQMDDGCNRPDAIPNCKEEVARMVAWEKDHPRPPQPEPNHSKESYQGPNFFEQLQNEAKAEAATANRRALEAQRELERAAVDADAARRNYDNSVSDWETRSKRYQADADRAKYGLSVEQRHLEEVQKEATDRLERKAAEARQRGSDYNR